MVAVHYLADDARTPLDVAVARAEVERLQAGLPPTLLAARPEQLRRLARTALDAERAALRRRSKVGDEPALDLAAADAAVDAHAAVRDARDGVRAAASDGQRWLAIGNVWGVAGIAGGAALVFKLGYEPIATPVYAAVAGGAAGPIAMSVIGLTRRSVAAMRLASATTEWVGALAGTGFPTMGELWARRITHRAWARRHEEAIAASAVARDARAAWHRVAGPNHHPRQAPVLIDRLGELRAAQLDLFEALVADRVRRLAQPEPALGVVPFAVGWALEGRVNEEPRSRRLSAFRFWRH